MGYRYRLGKPSPRIPMGRRIPGALKTATIFTATDVSIGGGQPRAAVTVSVRSPSSRVRQPAQRAIRR